MEIDIFTLCDFAQDMGGKLTIVGTFDTINASELPMILPTLSVATRIRFSKSQAGNHSFRLSFLDDNNKEIIPPLSGQINVRSREEEWSPVNIVVGIGQMKLGFYGIYSINLSIDDKLIKSLPFFVKEVSKKSNGS